MSVNRHPENCVDIQNTQYDQNVSVYAELNLHIREVPYIFVWSFCSEDPSEFPLLGPIGSPGKSTLSSSTSKISFKLVKIPDIRFLTPFTFIVDIISFITTKLIHSNLINK